MRIACPECNAAYDVPGANLAPGRGVRCIRCSAVWVPVANTDATPLIQPQPEPAPRPTPATVEATAAAPPPEPPPAEPPPPECPTSSPPSPATARVLVMKAHVQRRAVPALAGLPVLIGWLVTVLVLAELAYIVVAYPGPIIRAWPPAERAYAWFGAVRP